MAEEEIALKIEIESDRAQMSLEELEKGFDGLQEKLKGTKRNTEEGRAEFKKLSTQLAQASGEIKNLELGFEGLDREQITSEFAGMAGGIGDVTASLVLMGGENETIEQIGASIEKAMAISMGMKGAMEGAASASKLYTNSLKAQAIASKAMAFMQGVLNAVMSLNPIGLIVLGIGALIGIFVLLSSKIRGFIGGALEPLWTIMGAVADGFKWLGGVIVDILAFAFKPLIDMVKKVIETMKWLGIIEDDTQKAVRKAGEAKIESYKKQAKELKKLQKAHEELSKKVIKDLDYEVALIKAKGEDTTAIEYEVLREKNKIAKKTLELAQKSYKAEKAILDNKRNYGQEVTQEEIKRINEITKAVNEAAEAFKDSGRAKTLFTETNNAKNKAAAEAAAKEASDRRKSQREKDKEAEEKAAADALAVAEKAAADAIALEIDKNKLLEDLEAKAIEDKTTRALAELEIAQERQRAQLIEKYGLDTELMKALETEQLLQMNTLIEGIEQEARDKSAALDQEARDKQAVLDQEQRDKDLAADQKALDDKKAQRDKDFALATAAIGALTALNDAALATDLLNAAGNDAKQEKIRKASFERQKKLNIAMAAINGAQAVIAGFAQGGLPMAILAGVTAAAQLAAIVATTYQSSASPTEVDETVPTPDGAGGGGGGAQINAVTNTSTILGNQQVFVTETDITDTQNNVSVIEESATF